jgi:hypothetical protein
MTEQMRTYTEMAKRSTLLARFRYLSLRAQIGVDTFGYERPLNQAFYSSREWRNARDIAIIRDNGFELGLPGNPIVDHVFVHHMNPLTPEIIHNRDWDSLINPEYLICCSQRVHNAIHYGDESLLSQPLIERRPGDHVAWKE